MKKKFISRTQAKYLLQFWSAFKIFLCDRNENIILWHVKLENEILFWRVANLNIKSFSEENLNEQAGVNYFQGYD